MVTMFRANLNQGNGLLLPNLSDGKLRELYQKVIGKALKDRRKDKKGQSVYNDHYWEFKNNYTKGTAC